jgi:hypothetical protein
VYVPVLLRHRPRTRAPGCPPMTIEKPI